MHDFSDANESSDLDTQPQAASGSKRRRANSNVTDSESNHSSHTNPSEGTVSYPNKRNPLRSWRHQWLRQFSWLEYNERTDVARCSQNVCQKYILLSNIVGSDCRTWIKPFQVRLFTQHEKSEKHIQNGKPKLQLGQQTLPSSVRFRTISDAAVWTRIHAIWWLAREDVAIHKFTSFITSHLVNTGKAPPTTYCDDYAAWEIAVLLSKYFKNLLKQRLSKSPYYGIMVDETTDVSTNQQLIIYVKFLNKGSDGVFKPTIQYLDLVSPKSGQARDLQVSFSVLALSPYSC